MSIVEFVYPSIRYSGLSNGVLPLRLFADNAKDSREGKNPEAVSIGHTIQCSRIGDTL